MWNRRQSMGISRAERAVPSDAHTPDLYSVFVLDRRCGNYTVETLSPCSGGKCGGWAHVKAHGAETLLRAYTGLGPSGVKHRQERCAMLGDVSTVDKLRLTTGIRESGPMV